MKYAILILSSVAILSACTSISGRKIETNPVGQTKSVKVGGMPVAVKTYTKALFIVTESEYLVETLITPAIPDGAGNVTKAVTASRKEVTSQVTGPTLLGPTELFAIDIKRPFSGTADWEMDLAEQYPTKIKAKTEDKTLDGATALLEKLTKAAANPPVNPQGGDQETRTLVRQQVKLVLLDLKTGQVQTIYR